MKKYHDREWLETKYVTENKTQQEIADICGVNVTTISRWMKKHNIETKPKYIKTEPPGITLVDGYEYFTQRINDELCKISHHRLLAVSEYGFDEVINKDVHHVNEVRWDNRPENITLMSKDEHTSHHLNNGKLLNDMDKIRMVEMYRNGNISYKNLGKLFGVSNQTAWRTVTGVMNNGENAKIEI